MEADSQMHLLEAALPEPGKPGLGGRRADAPAQPRLRDAQCALGSGETTVMRMVTAYSMFANGGRRGKPTLIDRIQDRYGHTIYKHDQRECRDAPNVSACRSIVGIDGVEQGLKCSRAQALGLGADAAFAKEQTARRRADRQWYEVSNVRKVRHVRSLSGQV